MQWKRAHTPEEKHVLLVELERQWNVPPDMRLGQLIYNAINHWCQVNGKPTTARDLGREVFYVEDEDLVKVIARFLQDKYPPMASTSA